MLNGSISSGDVKGKLNFIIIPNTSFYLLIGRSNLDWLGGTIHFKTEEACPDYHERKVVLPVLYKYEWPRDLSEEVDSEESSSESKDDSSSSEEGTIRKAETSLQTMRSWEKGFVRGVDTSAVGRLLIAIKVVNEKFEYLNDIESRRISELFRLRVVMSLSPYNISPSLESIRIFFL